MRRSVGRSVEARGGGRSMSLISRCRDTSTWALRCHSFSWFQRHRPALHKVSLHYLYPGKTFKEGRVSQVFITCSHVAIWSCHAILLSNDQTILSKYAVPPNYLHFICKNGSSMLICTTLNVLMNYNLDKCIVC